MDETPMYFYHVASITVDFTSAKTEVCSNGNKKIRFSAVISYAASCYS